MHEKEVIPLGDKKGKRLEEVPVKDLDSLLGWLQGKPDVHPSFRRTLGQYLRQPAIQRLLEQELES